MNPLSLIHRKYKEKETPLSTGSTGRVYWTEWKIPDTENNCPQVFGWNYEPKEAGDIPGLEEAYYVATLSIGPLYPYAVQYMWVLPEHRDESEIPDGYVPVVETSDELDQDLYFVESPTGEWDLYSVSGKVPSTVHVKVVVVMEDGSTSSQEYELAIGYPGDSSGEPGFGISPPTFAFGLGEEDCIPVGDIVYDMDVVAAVVDARYDGECSGDDCLFYVVKDGNAFTLYTRYTESDKEHVEFLVPLYIRYVDVATGLEVEIRKEFTVYGRSTAMVAEPFVKYIRNLATRAGSYTRVDILGGNFSEDMSVRLGYGSEWSTMVPRSELVFNREGKWDTISFVMSPGLAMRGPGGEEPCAVYDLQVGYGDGEGFIGLAGTGDAKMLMENSVGLIRYKYDADTLAEQKKASAGAAVTTNSPCFYGTDIEMVFDSTDLKGNPVQAGGAAGKYGKTVYWRYDPDVDCETVRYIRVKVKYNKMLTYRKGPMVLDGISVTDGDVVWLAGQTDGTEGLWIVRTGDWEGLLSYLEPEEYSGKVGDPCTDPEQVPLAVDGGVFPDLGARVTDKVDLRCAQDVPVKYGTQTVCGKEAKPGDLVLLSNQSDGYDGVWEVTCADWIYRGPVDDNGTTEYDASGSILVQNDIDFCACRDGLSNPIYNVEYYYLNGGCYLAKAVRKVKMMCSSRGGIVPNNKVIITDYSITAGAEKELVVDTGITAGDGVAEDCTKPNDNFEQANSDRTAEVKSGCGTTGIVMTSPDCSNICDCRRYYLLDPDFDGTTVTNGFSIVFWQFGEGGWHLYAYVQQKGGGTALSYYVYHLHTCGTIATPGMVDENTDVYIVDDRGLPTSRRTKDAWFVPHGGVLADGFGMYDEGWVFVLPLLDDDGNPTYDEYGNKLTYVSHELNADTLFQSWSLHAPKVGAKSSTKMLAHAGTLGDSEVPVGMEHTYGFRFFHTPLTKERFCQIYNASNAGCICQSTWTGLATDQCYDSDGYGVSCDEFASEGNAFIATDDGEVIEVERACFDETGRKIDCE